ncbi:glycosyltransferase family 2 protein [Lampropedia puyangensis]|uniref:Glycosyltransferase family 2 protein n=1 Tax=Lampropedia puyangensis TaxID=1330072 RepID=A0A4S8F5M8_9BURK|nr:glycosyltransferase family 2 protein [Lampropedia puyangensis]THU01464.1 glycosyltransferase family 2 protein [Lampropedia puyangensis]
MGEQTSEQAPNAIQAQVRSIDAQSLQQDGSVWLSVLIPVYNVQAYLRECVESIMQQASTGVEVLLFDDASTDDSAHIALQLQQQWPQAIRILGHERNLGISAVRNALLCHAQGEYLWFVDSDDALQPGAIRALQQVVQQSSPDVVLCDFRMWRNREKFKHRLRGERHCRSFVGPHGRLVHDTAALIEGLFLAGQMHPWSKITKRSLWQADATSDPLQFPVGAYFEDMATMPRVLLRAQSFVYVPEVWVAYRQREGSILSSLSPAKAFDLGMALDAFGADYLRQVKVNGALAAPGVQFAIAHLAARNYMSALRIGERGQVAFSATQRNRMVEVFLQASALSVPQLFQHYLRRGWWARYLRARRPLGQLHRMQGAVRG